MTVTTRDTGDDLSEQPEPTPGRPEAAASGVGIAEEAIPAPGVASAPDNSPTEGQPLLMNAPADRCRVCSAEMATDQRYCVECGTRRGKPRFTLAKGAASATAETPNTPSVVVAGWTKLTGLLAIAVVLLALGVGVLIGNAGGSGGGTSASATAAKTTSSSSPSSCTAGTAGCKNGKQTGNFFSSGS